MKGLIDIGAHFAEEYFEINPEERDHMHFLFFEPVKESYEDMCRRLPDSSNIKTFNVALGNIPGRVEMYVDSTNKGQSSSILRPKLHLKEHPWVKFTKREFVGVMRLDDIEYDRTLYDVMHIDVQGYELEVLKGANKSLAYIDEITVEVNVAELYEGIPMLRDIDEYLNREGFFRVKVKWLTKLWGDATYKRIK
jgi:FkbM family methyltransferase